MDNVTENIDIPNLDGTKIDKIDIDEIDIDEIDIEVDPESPKIKYDLSIDSIMWEPYYVLAKASFGQIMKTLILIHERQVNRYHNTTFTKILSSIIDPYVSILATSDYEMQNVVYHNLILNLPVGINVDNEIYGKVQLAFARTIDLIPCLIQRTEFIINREVPIPKWPNPNIKHENYVKAFNNLKVLLVDFLKIVKNAESDFKIFIESKNIKK